MATPTPTVTPAPTSAATMTPTSTWLTPTPYPTADATAVLNFGNDSMFVAVAEQSVQTWNLANQGGVIDNLMWIPITLVIFVTLRKFINGVKRL